MELLDKKLRNRNFSPGLSPRMITLKSAKKSREDFKKSASTSNICDFDEDDNQSIIVAQLKLQTLKRKLIRNGSTNNEYKGKTCERCCKSVRCTLSEYIFVKNVLNGGFCL